MSPPKVYHSAHAPVPIVRRSIFTHLFTEKYFNEGALPEKPAYIDAATGQTLTRENVRSLSLKFAWGLRNVLILKEGKGERRMVRGDTVMIMSSNSMSWPIALFGCIAAGLKITFASCGSTPRELSQQYLDSRPSIILVESRLVPVVHQMSALIGGPSSTSENINQCMWTMDDLSGCTPSLESVPTVVSGTKVNRCADLVQGESLTREELFDGNAAEETAYICYSSGTTGKPKGVETSHKNVCSVLGMTKALWKGCETPHDVYLAVLPVYHMFGLVIQLHYPFMRGRPTVMLNQSFSLAGFCQAVQTYRATSLLLVPPIILALSEFQDLNRYDLRSITNIASGAAPLSLALANKFLGQLKKQGGNVILIQGCGSTETTCPCQIVKPEDAFAKFGSVGQLLPNIEARLIIEASGEGEGEMRFRDAKEGEAGEMWLKGPTITKGYLNNPAANLETFTKDGWFRTGDVLRRDEDGYYYIMDRKKEMLKYKGHQIAPAELEGILMENNEIGDAGVIGIMDAYSGNELPRAYVRPSNCDIFGTPSMKLEFEKRVEKWFEGQVSSLKYLRGGVVAVSDVPKRHVIDRFLATGKILRKELREWAQSEKGTPAGQKPLAKL